MSPVMWIQSASVYSIGPSAGPGRVAADIVSLVRVAHLSAMSQELSLGERRFTASGDPMDGFSCERKISSACSIACQHSHDIIEKRLIQWCGDECEAHASTH